MCECVYRLCLDAAHAEAKVKEDESGRTSSICRAKKLVNVIRADDLCCEPVTKFLRGDVTVEESSDTIEKRSYKMKYLIIPNM